MMLSLHNVESILIQKAGDSNRKKQIKFEVKFETSEEEFVDHFKGIFIYFSRD